MRPDISGISEAYLRNHPYYGTNWFVIAYRDKDDVVVLWHYGTDYGLGKVL